MNAPMTPIDRLALVREANHRFANHLAVIASAVNRKLAELNASTAELMPRAQMQGMLEELASCVYCIADLNRLVARNPLAGDVDLKELLRLTTRNTISSLSLDDRLSLHATFAGDLSVPRETAHSILLIVMEIVMNAIKYAHPTGIRVAMTLSCERHADGNLVLEIADDGCGLPENFDVEKDGNIGFKLIRVMAKSLGTLNIESTPLGLGFRLDVLPPRD